MKTPTILKDELSLLHTDRSAVLTELRRASQELKDTHDLILEAEQKEKEVRDAILEDTARLEDIRSRAVVVKTELATCKQDLRNTQLSYESARVKNSQEYKLHLGRIKEAEEQEAVIIKEIAELKALYDKNSDVYAQSMSDKQVHLRDLDKLIKEATSQLNKSEKELAKNKEEDKRITKERLKREDKVRAREKMVDTRNISLDKKEEDLLTMSKDMVIIYGRLKEIYTKVDPSVDLDRLIMQAI